ncbi:NAD-dependent epimerase/dehydratase family protein [Amycolatopsis jejuensis]|uniref:NAD-dependent epimerase/dehydratase family protein n=1 Tax=Amycolatopsis jejuensis TaxID=330084 RepID=UPI0005256828|nr:NAD(P)-dependent oxidoreductase [Amycolatopsis jejuensis]
MRIAVAGATGVVGRALVPVLRAAGHHVTALVRDPASVDADAVLTADALDPSAVRAAVAAARPEILVHQLSALRSPTAFESTARLRREGTASLIAAAREAGVRRVIAQSIAFAHAPVGALVVDEDAPLYLDAPDPGWAMTVGAVADLERQVLSVGGTVLRYGALYGTGTQYSLDGPFATALTRGRYPLAGDGAGMTSFLHVSDAAQAVAAAVESAATGVFHITDDHPVPASSWLPSFAARVGGPPPRVLPAPMVERMLGWPAAHQMTAQRGAANTRARATLGWHPSRVPEWTT